MKPQDVLAEVEGSGFRLTLRPGGLRLTGESEPLPVLLDMIRKHRGALVEFMEAEGRAQAAHETSLASGRLTLFPARLLDLIHPTIRHLVAPEAGTVRQRLRG